MGVMYRDRGGGGGGGGVKNKNKLSFHVFSRFMQFPTFLEASEPVGGRSRVTELPCFCIKQYIFIDLLKQENYINIFQLRFTSSQAVGEWCISIPQAGRTFPPGVWDHVWIRPRSPEQ